MTDEIWPMRQHKVRDISLLLGGCHTLQSVSEWPMVSAHNHCFLPARATPGTAEALS